MFLPFVTVTVLLPLIRFRNVAMPCCEFDLIARYFDRFRTNRRDVILGIGDDCALLTVSDQQQLAVTTDTLVSGTHFMENIDPRDLGYKALAVNLSDLAAMGASPAWLSLALTLPAVDECWLQKFSDALFEQLNDYGMQLIGGDTTRGPLSLTLTVQGLVPKGCALRRAGAKKGDWICVTGTLGDSAAGLAILQGRLSPDNDADRRELLNRHLRPQPRLLHGQKLRGLASAAIDISDGLISDLPHILTASHCGAEINLECLPYSSALKSQADAEQALYWALAGGEDYELCFTVPAEITPAALDVALDDPGAGYSCIGQIVAQKGITFLRQGEPVALSWLKGFNHFAAG